MLDQSADSPNEVVSRGFKILINANECVRNTSKQLYRDNPTVLNVGTGSEFFKRLKATLRYQLLVGEGLPSKVRYKKALTMHPSASTEPGVGDEKRDVT